MEVQKCVLLVYGWLKEHGLQKTCTALVEEYGSSLISDAPLALTLGDILESVSALLQVYTNSSLSKLLTTLNTKPPDPNIKAKPGKPKAAAKKPRKRKASVSQDAKSAAKTETSPATKVNTPVADVNDVCTSISNSNVGSALEASESSNVQKNPPVMKEKKVPKEKKLPLFPADVWVCPEMEETLTKVYERTMLSIDIDKIVDIPLLPEVVAVLSDSKDEEENPDVDIESIEVIEPVREPVDVPLVVKDDGEMFTEDSDSDSEDESPNRTEKNTTVIPPSSPIKTNIAEITKNTLSSPTVLQNHLTTPEKTEKKKRKKKKNFAAHLQNIENPITPLEIVGSDETSYIVKKKKKKNVEEIQALSQFSPLVPATDSSTSETDSNKKKMTKDDVPVVPPMEAIVEVNQNPEEEVKKKKKKKKSIGGAHDVVLNGPTAQDIVATSPTTVETKNQMDAVALETALAPETPPAKKKKKKIHVEPENSTSSMSATFVASTPSKENIPTDDQLALTTLGQSLKKKKKKSKNIGQ